MHNGSLLLLHKWAPGMRSATGIRSWVPRGYAGIFSYEINIEVK